MSSNELPKVPSKVPAIRVLRERINYGESKTELGSKFWKDLKFFRENYRTDLGARGDDFVAWEDETHMEGLKQMVDTYLHLEDGARFWPSDEDSAEFNTLRYSVDVDCEL